MGALSGRKVLLTGASAGIGAAIADLFIKEGGIVANLDRNPPNKPQQGMIHYRCDVARRQRLEYCVTRAVEELGGIDHAISCAAFSVREPIVSAGMDWIERTFDVCAMGGIFFITYAFRQMVLLGKGGNIVTIGSPLALPHQCRPFTGAYSAAKAALEQYTRTTAAEGLQYGIRANIVQPGWTDTPGERNFCSEDDIRTGALGLPLRRLARPEEIARVVLFLCDPASSYITGSTYTVDGGLNLPRQS